MSGRFLTKFFSCLAGLGALGFFHSPVYAHHTPGDASVTLTVVGCDTSANPSCTATFTNTSGLNCRVSTDGKRNVTCNLPQPVTIPSSPVAGQPQFELRRTVDAVDSSGNALGAEFVALCNASSITGDCDNTVLYKFTNSTIRKLSASTTTAQQVRIDFAFTIGLVPDQSLNSATLDGTIGRSHGFSSRGTEVPSGSLTALGNTHSAAASFTYVLSNNTCGTTSDSTPEPFDISGCTATMVIPCVSPTTSSTTCVNCSATGGTYSVNNSFLTSWNNITVAGNMVLQDSLQRTCSNLFNGNPDCRAIERGSATLTYGFRRQNDRVNVTSSSVGTSGLYQDLLATNAGETMGCNLHESGGGVSINPNDNGNYKIKVFGSATIDTNTLKVANTFISLPGGGLMPATDIRYNQNFADPLTGVADQFPDAWVVFDSSDLTPVGGISCQLYANQTLTLVVQSTADVTVSGTTVVAGKNNRTKNFGNFTTVKFDAPVSCEIPALVSPCNNP